MKTIKHLVTGIVIALAAAGCSGPDQPRERGVYMLLDTSGTYTQELDKARQIIAYLLTQMDAGDVFAVGRIDTGSFSEKDIVAKATFDDRPSAANKQKRIFMESIDAFIEDARGSSHTDITGGLLIAEEYLNEHDLGPKTVLVFSDMKEDLPEEYNRDIPLRLDGIEVVAVNVTKLRTDNVNPQEYLDRLDEWQSRVEAGGGEWRVVNYLDRLGQLLKQ
jgi:hypothetical protein